MSPLLTQLSLAALLIAALVLLLFALNRSPRRTR